MSPIYVPGKVTLKKEFTPQSYMYEFPSQYPVWTPADITTALWLDAADASTITESGGAVSQWDDKSGNSNHATAASGQEPTYNQATKRVEFDGTELMALPSNLASCNAVSMFYVAKSTGVTSPNPLGYPVFAKGTGDSRFYVGPRENTLNLQFTAGAITPDIRVAYSTSSDYLAEGVWQDNVCDFFLNGSSIYTSAETTTSAIVDWLIGGFVNTPTLVGNVAEIILFTSAPSVNTRQKIEGYLAHKWGLTANLPAGHPYKTVGPTP